MLIAINTNGEKITPHENESGFWTLFENEVINDRELSKISISYFIERNKNK